jgi:hypothetical protein
MESPKLTDNVNEISQNVKDYVRLQTDLLKLTLTEKLALILSALLVAIICFLVLLFITIFLSQAFIFWYRDHGGSLFTGALIVSGFYLLFGIFVYLSRKWLFVNPLVSLISKFLLEEENDGN